MIGSALISVIVPCFNQAQYLNETIECLFAQSIKNWECIIVNDSSPDDTEAIALKLCDRDKRIRYIKKENGGPSSARNKGIGISNGEYILPLDADDKIHPRYMEECINVLINNSAVKLVYAKAIKFGALNEEWKHPEYSYKEMLLNNMIYCSAIFRKKDFLLTDGYDECMRQGFEDWEFWLRFLSPEDRVYRIDEIMFYYRIKESSRTTSITSSIEQDIDSYIYYKHKDKYQAFFGHPLSILRENIQIKRMYRDSASYKIGNKLVHPLRYAQNQISKILNPKQ
jgi:glycosyltransferase involved in cell wall biosynthesis